jgi:hypothetical protein
VDTNETGTYLYLATDQVRFYPLESARNTAHAGGGGYETTYDWQTQTRGVNEAIALEQIPAVVFSEVLRDVDLFVGVASVGNDPTWVNGGPEGHREYWQSYSFGDLSATAESRKATLEMLVNQTINTCVSFRAALEIRSTRASCVFPLKVIACWQSSCPKPSCFPRIRKSRMKRSPGNWGVETQVRTCRT